MFADGASILAVSRRGETLWRTPVLDPRPGQGDGKPPAIRVAAQTAGGQVIASHDCCVDLYAVEDGARMARLVFDDAVDDVAVTASHILVSAGGTVHCFGDREPVGRLTFDVVPCAGEIHIGLGSVRWIPGPGQPEEDPLFDGEPEVFCTINGETRRLGAFCAGCSGGQRLHEPPPAREGTAEIRIVGMRADGTAMTGAQTVDMADY